MYSFNQTDSVKQSNYSSVKANFVKKILMLGFVALIFAFSNGAANAATYTVTSTADTGGNTCAANCTLRQAINAAFNDPNAVINFNIPGGGVKTIAPLSQLPNVYHQTIDGTTQPGYSGTPLIELSGVNLSGNPSYGLVLRRDATIRGLIINRFNGSGIYLVSDTDILDDTPVSMNVVIKGNYIGTNAAGNVALGNGYGIYIKAFSGTVTVGGTGANDRNIISGNNFSGIDISGCVINQTEHIVAVVKGNYIGTDATGNVALGNLESGVKDECSDTTTIGGKTAAERNIISGNKLHGITLSGSTEIVQGNYIGTNAAGTVDLGNSFQGNYANSGGSPVIGGNTSGAGNLISGK